MIASHLTSWKQAAGRRAAGILTLALTATALAVIQAPAADAYPGSDDIAAAKAAAEDQAATVAQLDAAIAQLEGAAQQANVAALSAAEDYNVAQEANIQAQRDLFAANARADEAQEALDEATSALAAVALADYRNGGDLASLEAIMTADGFDEVITRTESLDRASSQVETVLQQVKAAELVSDTMRGFAEDAADVATEAEQAALDTLQTAQQAQADANAAVDQAAAVQTAALEKLADLQGTTVALEQARQDGLAAERASAERAAADAAAKKAAEERAAAEKEAADNAANNSSGGSGSTGGGSTGSGSGSTGGGSTGGSTDSGSGSTGGGSTGSGSGSTGSGSTGGGSTDTGSGSGSTDTGSGSGSTDSGSSSGWKSSASQGQSAAAYALTLTGATYAYGGSGPAYDCSGLTQVAWGSVGYYIPHSSRMQYSYTTHVSFSQLRVGDLIFWGTGRNASAIYHVAIYIGSGKVMEAKAPGTLAGTRVYNNWAVSDIMPYAGRV